MSERILMLYDERMLEHVNFPGHPERPDRLRAILRELARSPVEGLEWFKPNAASLEEVRRVHSVAHVDRIDLMRGRTSRLDPDTGVAPGSTEAAYRAAGAAVDLVEALISGEVKRAFALVRPPGHHAEHDRVRGFCYFNNIAIAAEHARVRHGCKRILIIDWDVHHCNGTQGSFYETDEVLVFSSHRYPFFPGTGWLDETGEGDGEGYTVNLPLTAGTGDGLVVALYESMLPPIAEAYQPDLVLVSAGFDAHLYDPLGGLRMTEEGFAIVCALARDLADRYAGGRLGLFLEGGYDLDALGKSVRVCLQMMTGEKAPAPGRVEEAGAEAALEQFRGVYRPYWPVLAE
ncbi:MAG: histone deacetylase [Planctomycetota bacterium]|nr:histone deacetylase [Planctomycetota bacterium]